MKKLKLLLVTALLATSLTTIACSPEDDLYKVTLMDGTQVAIELSKEKGEYLDSLPNAPSKDGYVFEGWYQDAELTTPYQSDVLSGDLVLYAKYTPANYSIIFNTNGGGDLAPLSVTYGAPYELPVPVKEGYTFVEWTLEGFNFPSSGNYEKTSAVRVTASWVINEYTVTYMNGENVLETKKVTHNEVAPQWNNPQTGYKVEGIYTDVEMTSAYENGKITADTTLYVNILPIQYKITINEMGGEEVQDVTVAYASNYTLDVPVREGYTFTGYTLANGEAFAISGQYLTASDVAVIANWQINEYQVVFMNGEEELLIETVEFGKKVVLWNSPEAGYKVEGIYTDEEMTTAFDKESLIKADLVLYVNIIADTFRINVNEMGGTAVDTTAVYKQAYLVEIPVREGYDFIKFTLADGSDFAREGVYNWTSDITVTAVWERQADYHKTSILFYNGNDEVDAFTITVDDGSAFSIPATHVLTKKGYTFDGWFTDANLTEKYVDGTIINAEHLDIDILLYAGFTANSYAITVDLAGGSIEGESSYAIDVVFDSQYSLASPEKVGYTFTGYTYNGKAFALEGKFDIDSDVELVANWQINSYDVVYMNGSVVLYTESIEYGATANGWDSPEAGYKVEGIYSDVDLTAKFDFESAITTETVLYVKIIPCTYTITLKLAGGMIDEDYTPDPISVDYKANYSIEMPIREGFSFIGFKTADGKEFALSGSYEYTDNVTITAEWKSLVADADQAGNELFIKKGTYFKIRNTTDEEFTFVFLTGMTYSFPNHIIDAKNAGVNAQKVNDTSFKALTATGTFDLVLTRQESTGSITYSRKAIIVENVNTFNYGEDYLGSWGNKGSDDFRNEFINKKADKNLEVGFANFIPDIVITNLDHAKLSLEQSNISVVVKLDGNEIHDYVVDSDGTISFGEALVGRTVEVTLKPIYDIYNATPIVFNLDINAGVNVYNDAELKSAYSDLSVNEINLLRNVVATVLKEHTVNREGVYAANTYIEGSAYMRQTTITDDVITINGNFFEIGANAKVIYEGGKEVGIESSLPIINNNEGYSYRNWSVDGTTGYYVANVQNGIFSYMNGNNEDNSRMHNGQITFNDLRITGSAVGDQSLAVNSYKGVNFDKPLLLKGSTYHGIVIRGGTASVNNTTITNTNTALFTDSEISATLDENGQETQAVHWNLNEVRTDNNFQSSMYIYLVTKVDIKNSQFGKSTSAVISMEDGALPSTSTLYIDLTIDKNTTFKNFVSGDEAWFVAYGMAPLAATMKTTIEGIVNMSTEGKFTAIHNNMINFIFFCRSTKGSTTGDWNADFNKKPFVVINGIHDMAANQGVNLEGDTFLLFNTNQATNPNDFSHFQPTAGVADPENYIVGGIEVFYKGKYQ